MEVDFKQEWYGIQSKIIEQTDDFIVIDYGCRGHGIITNYFLFDGIQLCFLDFDTSESMPSQKFNPDIIQITHCQEGRYECEFANHTVSYLRLIRGLFKKNREKISRRERLIGM